MVFTSYIKQYFSNIMAVSFFDGPEYPQKTTHLSQETDKCHHIAIGVKMK